MDAALTRRALAIFEEALETTDADRDAYLATACAGDLPLLEEVRRLLKADAMAERAMPTGGLQPRDEPMPSRIGRYRIVERIGQGGMGDVFVGARDDGLFEHAVAIKRVRPTLFAETARTWDDRFEAAIRDGGATGRVAETLARYAGAFPPGQGDLLQAQGLLDAERRHRAALDRRVRGDDHAAHIGHVADAGDHVAASQRAILVVVHLVAAQGR